jgi:hypothetical protein
MKDARHQAALSYLRETSAHDIMWTNEVDINRPRDSKLPVAKGRHTNAVAYRDHVQCHLLHANGRSVTPKIKPPQSSIYCTTPLVRAPPFITSDQIAPIVSNTLNDRPNSCCDTRNATGEPTLTQSIKATVANPAIGPQAGSHRLIVIVIPTFEVSLDDRNACPTNTIANKHPCGRQVAMI